MECSEPTFTRRSVLVTGVAVAGAAGVAAMAGCSSSKKSAPAAATGSASASPTVLAKVADIPVGDAISATLDGQPIVISQPTAGTVVAFTAICTHQGCTVAPAGTTFHCPCHDSVFNATNGQVISGPAQAALDSIPVKITGGNVVSG